MDRILIATRGVMALRLIRYFKDKGIETVSVFSEPDVDEPWVEEADYPLYLNGKTVEETYLNPARIVAAALDSGCDAIHPGCNFLADNIDLFDQAASANVPVIGTNPTLLLTIGDRMKLRAVAGQVGLSLVPASDVLATGDDGVAEGAQLGFPLFIKAVAGRLMREVSGPSELLEGVRALRRRAKERYQDDRVYLERVVSGARNIGTLVAADRAGTFATLGHIDGSLREGGHTWVEELGPETVSAPLSITLNAQSVALAKALNWFGIGRVQWVVHPDGAVYFVGFSARLPQGFSLIEAVYDFDLIHAQYQLQLGEPLEWEPHATPPQHGIQLRLLHGVPGGTVRLTERLTALQVPDEHAIEVALPLEHTVGPLNDPLLAKLTVLGPTRSAALVQTRVALQHTALEGLSTNLQTLSKLMSDETVWRGEHDASFLHKLLPSR